MRQRKLLVVAFVVLALTLASARSRGRNVAVPQSCTPEVNATLQHMIDAHAQQKVENVMVCGVAQGTDYRATGPHGPHHIITVKVTLPGGRSATVQIAINDSLDGAVSAKAGDAVFAYGQGYIPDRGRWDAGVHDVHCSTHRGADNGWVVVNGTKTPSSCGF